MFPFAKIFQQRQNLTAIALPLLEIDSMAIKRKNYLIGVKTDPVIDDILSHVI